jgi:hypothetical protein
VWLVGNLGLVWRAVEVRLSLFNLLLTMKLQWTILILIATLHLSSCDDDEGGGSAVPPSYFNLESVDIGGKANTSRLVDIPITSAVKLTFSDKLDQESALTAIKLRQGFADVSATIAFENGDSTVVIDPNESLTYLRAYTIDIDETLTSTKRAQLRTGTSLKFVTTYDPSRKKESITDEELLTLVQQTTFKYFWDYAEPNSGMARERMGSGELVTSGGSGFGLMAIIVGIERNFISRSEGVERLAKILTFLEGADRFHGAWSHWINGSTGKVIPFSANDNGGDLVETSFLVQGLLTFRQYLDGSNANEKALIDRINALWESVEWDWYRKDAEDVLYWHWSPDKAWTMNHQIRGHNETLITYVLAASSPTHTIPASVYHNGYARGGDIVNGKTFYERKLPLGEDYGGPLFFTHYSFLGLDPRNLVDTYGDYWQQNVNHANIHYEYAKANPRGWAGYGEHSWGLTASDNFQGYSAHSPSNDIGVISPTAALSSFPYTPEQSMNALRFFYYTLGDRLWGTYGFVDAFSLSEPWFANSYLAIDQGPIIVMIENRRSSLLWELFMSAPEVQNGLTKLGFQY